jgi:PPM family protein phosphatase
MVKAGIQCAGASDPGLVRQNNEDAFYFDPERGFFLVVDGIGGQAAGEKAAEIAVNRIRARLGRQTGTAEERIREAITVANNEIVRTASAHPEWAGMACVLTVAVLENGAAIVGHVGDSRLYKIRRGAIQKLTHDHSPVGEREDRGELSEAEAMRHPRRNEVFRDVGSEEHAPEDADFIEILQVPFEPDSALLLCSDGLSDQVTSREIRETVERRARNPEAAVRELIDAANLSGGKDNVTVLIVEGEEFSGRTPVDSQCERSRWGIGAALFFCGALAALAAGWFTRPLWLQAPAPDIQTVPARVLAVGVNSQFSTIAEALAAAQSGDTVSLEPGEYREQLVLKSGVAIRSRVPREAVLRAGPAGMGPAILAEGIRNAQLNGLRIVGDAQMPLAEGIVLINSEVEIDDTEVSGAGVGIEIRGAASPKLLANAIHDCLNEGILISGTSAAWLSHNSLQRNGRAGIAARDGAHPALVGNVFEKNDIELPAGANMDAVRQMNFFIGVKPGRGPFRK